MYRRTGFMILLLSIALVATGCLGSLFGSSKPVLVSGTVTIDGDVPGDTEVVIKVSGRPIQTEANAEGKFSLELAPGKYTLVAHANPLRYELASQTINLEKGKSLTGLELDVQPLPPGGLELTMPEYADLIQKPWASVLFEVKADPFGETTLYFPPGSESQKPPTVFKDMRFVVFDTPPVDTFRVSVEQLGEGGPTPPKNYPDVSGGNRSLSIVFGYEDVNNWWVIYYTYTGTTRVGRMIDGDKLGDICRPGETRQWMPNNDEYQLAEVGLTRVGEDMVVTAYANGEAITLDGCSFPAADYTPGKIGIGGHAHSVIQSWYFRNIVIEEL